MITAAVVYIVVSVLLIVASSLIFLKALQSLRQGSSIKPTEISGSKPVVLSELKNREEIIAQLERQFRSSPSDL
ncbi:hypothetical protein Syn7502_00509 [Synechococcus sp. PCC 7502]|uniref:hypothetical protein n=1 Tax=Synechococcus sp. PCC 7502 TaxID=1173263 RepID=UPI00029FF33E|nr:hypothetical protein [Synechococcus sp. PCC 7502]AFY72667.1 hypothetical protein Syn7502_00509 [Synechococcus sp. PCC 7502]